MLLIQVLGESSYIIVSVAIHFVVDDSIHVPLHFYGIIFIQMSSIPCIWIVIPLLNLFRPIHDWNAIRGNIPLWKPHIKMKYVLIIGYVSMLATDNYSR